MIRLIPVFLVLSSITLSTPVIAETARVYSGEHGNFTRLVVELPSARAWSVGRVPEGYAFSVKDEAPPDYDLTAVWQRIGQDRISALDIDVVSGALFVRLACDCHLFPFEYQPGVIVLDIKNGPAPEASVFEAAFVDDSRAPSSNTDAASARNYDWLAELPSADAQSPQADLSLPLPTGAVSLEPIRRELLEQLAQGATEGVVEMRLPPEREDVKLADPETLPWSNIRLGEHPGFQITGPQDSSDGTLPASVCIADDLVDLPAWGSSGTPLDLLSLARSGLYGEFDVPSPDGALQSVRLHLYLGFGAEAGQIVSLLDQDSHGETVNVYRSLSRLVDGDSDPDTPFKFMLDCDGPAALWAALAWERLPAGPGVNRAAILRAFLALPSSLRSHLGASLAERFLARDDPDAARIIRDAMARATEADPGAVALLDAERDLHLGNTETARDHAHLAAALDGNHADALVALVETHVRLFDAISPDVPEALLALRSDIGSADAASAIDRAIVLSLALSGQIEAAFMHADRKGAEPAELWGVLEALASDDDFLRHAVLPGDARPSGIASGLDLAIARRLLDLGFPEPALIWTGPVQPTDPPDRRLVAAEAELMRGDARRAVDLLTGLPETEAAVLLAKAHLQLGDFPAARASLAAAGHTDAAMRATLWQGNWSNLDPSAPEAWHAAARMAEPMPDNALVGLLGRGSGAVKSSTDSRTAIETLLGSITGPEND